MSWQARLTHLFLRAFIKPALARESKVTPERVRAVRRRGLWCARWLVRPLRGTRVRPVDAGRFRGEWVVAPGAREDRAIFFVHGGAFLIGSPGLYRHLVSRLSASAGAAVFSLDYRLAPEHPFPAALEDVLAAWEGLACRPLDPSRIAVAGDSAGGNLVLAAALELKRRGLPLPAAVLALAPWTDLTASGASVSGNARTDAFIPARLIKPVAAVYLDGADPRSAKASPLFGDFEGFPPLIVHVGSDEVLLDDSLRLAQAARDAGVDVTCKVWQGMPHVFQLFSPFVPEGRRSLEELGAYARERLGE